MLLQTHDLNNPSEIILNVETLCRLTGGKKNPQLNRVTKRYEVVVELAMKNLYLRKMLDIDPNFELGNRKWGKRIENGCMIEHKGKKYMECFVKEFLSGVTYYLDGTEISKDEIIGFPPTRENHTKIACYDVNNIRGMSLHPTSPFLRLKKVVALIKRLFTWK